jgi:hypothetical protein
MIKLRTGESAALMGFAPLISEAITSAKELRYRRGAAPDPKRQLRHDILRPPQWSSEPGGGVAAGTVARGIDFRHPWAMQDAAEPRWSLATTDQTESGTGQSHRQLR